MLHQRADGCDRRKKAAGSASDRLLADAWERAGSSLRWSVVDLLF